jgi:hypothetical protein
MRMLRVALVLLVLASFVAVTVAVSMAATVTPTVMATVKPIANETMQKTVKATIQPTGTMMPIQKTGKMIDMQQMKSNIGDVYKKLMMTTKMPAKPAMPGNNTTAMGGVNKTQSGMSAPAMSGKTANNTTAMGGVNKTENGMSAPVISGKTANNTTAMGGINKTANGMNQQRSQDKYSPSMKLSTPSMRSIPAPAAMNQLGVMPLAGSEKTKAGNATGKTC